jgi:hypothetical protein
MTDLTAESRATDLADVATKADIAMLRSEMATKADLAHWRPRSSNGWCRSCSARPA